MITKDDLRSVQYFWGEKGDLTRLSGWEERLDEFEKEIPMFVFAWKNYMIAKAAVDSLAERLTKEDWE